MNLILQRKANNNEATSGELFDDFIRVFTLEDQPQVKKVKGETRIPAGTYEIRERQVLSGLTKKYRKRFPWFNWHLELQGVPGFKHVYIHIGNSDDDTDGCILVGDKKTGFKVWESTQAYTRVYHYIMGVLKYGRVYITITDENQNFTYHEKE